MSTEQSPETLKIEDIENRMEDAAADTVHGGKVQMQDFHFTAKPRGNQILIDGSYS